MRLFEFKNGFKCIYTNISKNFLILTKNLKKKKVFTIFLSFSSKYYKIIKHCLNILDLL